MTDSLEQKAVAIGNNKKTLTKQLLYARACLKNEYRQLFREKKVNFGHKVMLSDCGKYALIWQVREWPDEPKSYNNQQTSTGCVHLFRVK